MLIGSLKKLMEHYKNILEHSVYIGTKLITPETIKWLDSHCQGDWGYDFIMSKDWKPGDLGMADRLIVYFEIEEDMTLFCLSCN
jgi:hypothetical protein